MLRCYRVNIKHGGAAGPGKYSLQLPSNRFSSSNVSPVLFSRHRGVLCSVFLVCLAVAGCASNPPASETSAEVVDRNRIPAEQKHLLILQSDNSPAFANVTRAITDKWKGGTTVYNLTGTADADADVIRRLQRHQNRVVIAVGLRAALAVRKLGDTKAIFCQVFNYEDHDLLKPWMKGVSALPPIGQQFQVWKKLDPTLKRVGVITGPRLLQLVAEARRAAAAHGIQLEHVEVNSDLETLYAYKKLSPTIQALWLLPDNRVLSRNAIRDLLSSSRKQGKQVMVFSPQLLPLGGTMNIDSVYSDIADQVIARSVQALDSDTSEVPGPPVVPLTRLDIKINPMAVKQLGLTVPTELRKLVYVP